MAKFKKQYETYKPFRNLALCEIVYDKWDYPSWATSGPMYLRTISKTYVLSLTKKDIGLQARQKLCRDGEIFNKILRVRIVNNQCNGRVLYSSQPSQL